MLSETERYEAALLYWVELPHRLQVLWASVRTCNHDGWSGLATSLLALSPSAILLWCPRVFCSRLLFWVHYLVTICRAYFFLATPMACGSSQARDQTQPQQWQYQIINPLGHQGTAAEYFCLCVYHSSKVISNPALCRFCFPRMCSVKCWLPGLLN